MNVLGRLTGIGAAASVTLGLLAGGCVLAATAGPRQAQATGTRALQQTIAGLPPLDKSVVATTNWSLVNTSFGGGGHRGRLRRATDPVQPRHRHQPVAPRFQRRPAHPRPAVGGLGGPDLRAVHLPVPVAHRTQRDTREAGGGLPLPAGRPPAAGGRQHADRRRSRAAEADTVHPGRDHPGRRPAGSGWSQARTLSIGVPSTQNPGVVNQIEPRRDRDRRAHRPGFPVLDDRSAAARGRPCPTPPRVCTGLARSSPIPASSARCSRSSARTGSSCSGSSRWTRPACTASPRPCTTRSTASPTAIRS